MDYKDMLAFMAVARCRSYAGAAAKLHLAQSALSRRVLRLEQGLGVPLLERHARGVRLTEAGKVLAERASRIEAEFREAEQVVRDLGRSPPGDVRMAIPQGASRLFTTPVVRRFQELHPKARLHIVERESFHNQESVRNGEVDFALVYGAQADDELVLAPLLLERIFVVGPAGGTGGCRLPESCDRETLARLPLILPAHPHGYRKVVATALGGDGRANVAMEVNGFATSLEMVRQGLGFTISTYPPIASGVEAGHFVAIPVAIAGNEVRLSLVRRADNPMPPLLQALHAVIEDVAHRLEAEPHCRRP